MKKQKTRKLPKRILAWIVCFAMTFSVLTVIPGGTMEVHAASADGAKIVAVAQSYMGKEQSVGRCLGFCRLVYREAGYSTAQDPNGCGSACAYHSWKVSSHLGSTNKDNIPLGALVFFSGASSQSVLSCGARPGHVGIYAGDGYIINARGTVTNGTNIKKDKISLWESWGYAFLGWRPISGYTLDSGGSAVHNPVGYYDSASGGIGKVRVTGWAYDPDDLTQSIPIHVYIGGPAGVGEGHAITANVPRQDVDNVHHVGVYHGFDAVIQTSRSGLQPIYIYAINIGAGDNSCLGSMTANITADTTAPTISDIRVTDVNSEGYTIICRVEDEGSVAKVQFPTWTTYGDQDDLMASWWNNAACRGTQNGTTWSYRVNTNDHNNEEGFYNTHIYAYDAAGNSSCAIQNGIYIDRTPPTISDVQVTDIDATGYTVTCKVEDASSEIMKVQFPTWTTENGQDDLAVNWMNNPACLGTQNGTTWSFRVNDREHNYERGEYRTHIYAWDSFGNCASSSQGLNHIEFQNTYREINTASYNGHTYRLYNDCLSWDEAKTKCEEMGGYLATITSSEEQDVVAGLLKELTRTGYWIGGWKDGESLWVTREEFSYSNWYPGEPNGMNGENRYGIYTDNGKWNDFVNDYKGLGFICEWENRDDKNDSRKNLIAVRPENVRLWKTSVTWNGKSQKPSVMVTDNQGRPISRSDYTVSYSNNKNIGQATAIISFKNNYTGTIKKTFTIKPKGTSITKLTAQKKGFTAKWKKQKSQNAGHEIQYATNRKFKSAKTDYLNANTASQKFTKLKAKKKYYVRIRTYKYAWVNGRYTKLCSAWSKAKTVVTKR